ncbi:hypothetical protein DFQ28_005416 [Apophysomyces sp. BC1034]|nr:hypothetical protein DFQ30_010972 [Apophysomyces sp. BC1015]KAG0182310.1 hypothetical protein DFQ29_004863 [Apophysomyces sp. BC1021]KAG0193412.1 hypothetical protein DFQ28_005416 [Apophysomyces sp. BC1034]
MADVVVMTNNCTINYQHSLEKLVICGAEIADEIAKFIRVEVEEQDTNDDSCNGDDDDDDDDDDGALEIVP